MKLRTYYEIKMLSDELFASLAEAEAVAEAERERRERRYTLNKKSCIPFKLYYEDL